MKNMKNSMIKLLSVVFIIIFILTWLLPSSYYNGAELVKIGKSFGNGVGIFDAVSTFFYASTVPALIDNILFIFVVGLFYGILIKIPAYENILNAIASKANKYEKFYMIIISFLIVFIINLTGFSIANLLFIPFLVSLITKLGYSKENAIVTIIGSITSGLMGSILGSAFYSPMADALQKSDTLILFRLIVTILSFAILTFFICKMPKEENKAEKVKENLVKWPLYIFGSILLLIIVISMISWDRVLGINWFTELVKKMSGKGEGTIYTKVLGTTIIPFGYWTHQSLMKVTVISALLIGAFSKLGIDGLIEGIEDGFKKAIKPVIAFVIVNCILALSLLTPILFPIIIDLLKLGTSKLIYTFTLPLFTMISNLFVPELSLSSRFLSPAIIANVNNAETLNVFPFIWQMFTAVSMMILPTSLVLVAVISSYDICFRSYLKHVWKLLLSYLVLGFLMGFLALNFYKKLSLDVSKYRNNIAIILLIVIILIIIIIVALNIMMKKFRKTKKMIKKEKEVETKKVVKKEAVVKEEKPIKKKTKKTTKKLKK